MKIFYYLIFLVLIFSCNKPDYSLIYFNSEGLCILNNIDYVRLSDSYMEDGNWTILDDSDRLISKGQFENGFKIGIWEYLLNSDDTIKIKWDKYYNKDQNYKVNLPVNWLMNDTLNNLFESYHFINNSTNYETLVIIEHNENDIKMSVLEYSEYSKKMMELDSVKYRTVSDSVINGNEISYFTRYAYNDKIIFNFICENNGIIYDITYKTFLDINYSYILFFDFVRSLTIKNKRIFSPFVDKTEFRRISS